MKHVLETFHKDVCARVSVTDMAHKGDGVLHRGYVDDRTMPRWKNM